MTKVQATFFLAGIAVSSMIALIVIGTVSWITIAKPAAAIPSTLTDWGGMIIGFYFGSLGGLLKDLIVTKKESS